MNIPAALAILSCVILTGCNQITGSIDQSKICIFSDDAGAKKCNPDELAYYQPKFFGSEQLPLSAVAAYCDFNHQVVHTKGGVICIYTDKRLSLFNL